MTGIEHWQYHDELSVIRAALLTVNCDPAKHARVEELEVEDRPDGYEAMKNLIMSAVLSGKLPAKIKHQTQQTHYGYAGEELVPEYSPDWAETTVMVVDLKAYYSEIGFTCEFFFGIKKSDVPDYLDKNHLCYSPRLAAAIGGWKAVSTNMDLPQTRSPKYSLKSWLEENADSYELKKEDGSLNDSAIVEIAKVANWDRKGGAPRTPLSLATYQKTLPPPKPPKEKQGLPNPLAGDAIPF